tara:strand:- start:1065 stop:1667 length:603 start_codon:yes stop_codon:yes gene_type:complete
MSQYFTPPNQYSPKCQSFLKELIVQNLTRFINEDQEEWFYITQHSAELFSVNINHRLTEFSTCIEAAMYLYNYFARYEITWYGDGGNDTDTLDEDDTPCRYCGSDSDSGVCGTCTAREEDNNANSFEMADLSKIKPRDFGITDHLIVLNGERDKAHKQVEHYASKFSYPHHDGSACLIKALAVIKSIETSIELLTQIKDQ